MVSIRREVSYGDDDYLFHRSGTKPSDRLGYNTIKILLKPGKRYCDFFFFLLLRIKIHTRRVVRIISIAQSGRV